MSIQIISSRIDNDVWVQGIKNAVPDESVFLYPDIGNPEEVQYAIVWKPARGVFKKFPNLKVIASMGAGVDHILDDPDLPGDVLVTRITDEYLTSDMGEYVLAMVMNHLRHFKDLQQAQNEGRWAHGLYRRLSDVTVGVLGIGELGIYTAELLRKMGCRVNGWARSKKDIEGISTFSGDEELTDFLSLSEIVVCLLPLTSKTTGILNRDLFSKMPQGGYIINVARGQHLVDNDLIDAIDSGQLSGAALDVFQQEPLPKEHPFWKHPKITITPHVASFTKPEAVIPKLVDNFRRMKNGEPLVNVVDLAKGY